MIPCFNTDYLNVQTISSKCLQVLQMPGMNQSFDSGVTGSEKHLEHVAQPLRPDFGHHCFNRQSTRAGR